MTNDFIDQVRTWFASGKRVVLATVVATWGSSPRPAGSMMALTSDGGMVGSVSGGCVESSVVLAAKEVFGSGAPQLLSFCASDEAAHGVGLPCGGEVDVLVQPCESRVFDVLAEGLGGGESVLYLSALDGEPGQAAFSGSRSVRAGLGDGEIEHARRFLEERNVDALAESKAGVFEARGRRVFACRYSAQPTLVCIGAVHITVALLRLAKALGYRTVVVDPRTVFATDERLQDADVILRQWPQEALPSLGVDSSTAICTLTHDEKLDVPALRTALDTSAFYIGCLGKPATQAARKRILMEEERVGLGLHRVFAPIGLQLGGRSPEEIALSIMAQITAARYGRLESFGSSGGRTLEDAAL